MCDGGKANGERKGGRCLLWERKGTISASNLQMKKRGRSTNSDDGETGRRKTS